jgi:eukaryotic-like serine/threonine-protein kinase
MEPKLKDIEAIYHAALEREAGEERSAFVVTACGEDKTLCTQITDLLMTHEEVGDFLETPPQALGPVLDRPEMSEGPGTVIGPYKLLEHIGEGGFGAVYMAEQEEPIRRRVALKVIKLGMDTKQVIARFEAERQALALMDHPNIAKVFDAGATESGRPYFVMELVTGVSIIEYCNVNKLSTPERLQLFVQVCNAIQHAHQKGIIHRDLKPSNVMVTLHDGKPVPKVIDFGVAKATHQRLTEKTLFTRYAHMIGTPAYMSPEQAEMSGLGIDTRSDIYSLGVLLYELLTGVTPFCAEALRQAGYAEMQRIIREEDPATPSIKLSTLGDTLHQIAQERKTNPILLRKLLRGDLDWIVMKALDKDRTVRYATAADFARDIGRYLSSEPVSAGPPSPLYKMKRFVQRRRALVTTAAMITAAVLGGLIFSTVMYLQTHKALKNEIATRAELQAVSDFLTQDLLESVYPKKAGAQEVTVRHVLKTASENLQDKLHDSPLSEATIRQTLAHIFVKMGDYATAEPQLKRAVDIYRGQLGEDAPAFLTALASLGTLKWYQGQNDEAAQHLIQALDTRERVLGPEHPDTLAAMIRLAWLDTIRNYSSDAMTLAEEAYQTACRVLGKDHPVTLDASACLAMKLVAHGQKTQAEAIAPEALEISRRILGQEHETSLVLMNTLVWMYDLQGQHGKAMAMAERAFETSHRVFRETNLVALHSAANLGSLYAQMGRPDEAAPILTRSLALSRQHLGEGHGITICCALKLCILYRRQGRYDEHDPLLIELLGVIHRGQGEQSVLAGFAKHGLSVRVRQLLELIKTLEASGDREAAATARIRLKEIRDALKGPSGEPGERTG